MILTWLLSYIACVFIFYFAIYKEEDLEGEPFGYKVFIFTILFAPIINQLFGIFILLGILFKLIGEKLKPIRDKIKKIRINRRILKERKEKIKLGIIKITPQDPYGEDIWDEEDE